MASSSSQRVTKMVGSGALSHVYIQYPPFRCNIPGSSKMMYDDGNRLLLVPSPNKVFSWPVARDSHPDSPSITTVDGGPVLAARFSLDGKILAIQNSDQEVSFFNRESGLKFKQRSRSHTQQILGFFWTDCPTCDIVFVTSGGLELYSLASRLDSLKLVDVKPSQVSWFLYTHESRLVLLASGVQCKTFLCYQFSAGGIIRLPKFEASLRKAEANQKAVLGPEDVHIATMYGRLYCLQVDRLAMELNIYRFYRDAVVPQGMLPVYSDSVAFSVVDGVLLVHQLTSKVVLLYDIFTDMKAPISAPLPLLLRRHSGFTAIGSANHEDSDKALNSDESNIYGDSWVFANPDIILDQAHGIMWRIHLDLEALAASSSDVPSLLAFLQRRRLDASMVLLIQMLARDERYAEVMHFVRTKILEPSKEVANQLLEVGKFYSPIFTAGLNMLKQLSAHGDYLSAILQQGRLLEALRYARQNRVEAVAPATFLELAADSNDMQKLASVMRFCLDFVPSFESTTEYKKYVAVLSHQQSMIVA